MLSAPWIFRLTLGAALLACLGALPARAAEPAAPGASACYEPIAKAERTHRIPAQLLSAISVTESGRWLAEREETIAWPWTVYAEGEGRYLPSKAEAVAEVRRLQQRGVENIDVGCMQINLKYHPDAFDSVEEALTPEKNVEYAARFLVALKDRTRSWTQAIGHYHSSTVARQQGYRAKVTRNWREERRRAMAARQERVREAWLARRAARQAALVQAQADRRVE